MDADRDETNELIARLFSLMTARLEDAAGAAADGQGARVDVSARLALAERLRSAGQEVTVIAEAVGHLLGHRN